MVVTAAGTPPSLTPTRSINLGSGSGVGTLVQHPDATHTFLAAGSQAYDTAVSSVVYHVDLDRTLAEAKDRVVAQSVAGDAGGTEVVQLVFAADRGLAYVTNRTPDSVVALDAGLQAVEEQQLDGSFLVVKRPRYRVVGAAAVPAKPGGVVHIDRLAGPDLVIVASFMQDTLYVLAADAEGLTMVGRIDEVGVGPFALAHVRRGTRELLLVTTFFDHGLSVYDITAPAPAAFHRLAHLRSDAVPATEESR